MTAALTRRSLFGAAALLPFAAAAPAFADAASDAAHDKQLREDFPWLARYADANRALIASRPISAPEAKTRPPCIRLEKASALP